MASECHHGSSKPMEGCESSPRGVRSSCSAERGSGSGRSESSESERNRSQQTTNDGVGRSAEWIAEALEKLARFTIPEPNSGCILFTGGLTSAGYGMLSIQGERLMAHRIAYEANIGPIPAGLVLDHVTCQQRSCVNERHLEPVTSGENTLRGNGFSGINARKTVCDRGHDLAGPNLYASPDGHRHCVACTNASRRVYYEKHKPRILATMKAKRALAGFKGKAKDLSPVLAPTEAQR